MKGTYTKPLLTVEVFSLAQSTTRDCADTSIPKEQLNFGEPGSCVWDLGGGASMFTTEANCTIPAGEFYCYNNPAEGSYIFRS